MMEKHRLKISIGGRASWTSERRADAAERMRQRRRNGDLTGQQNPDGWKAGTVAAHRPKAKARRSKTMSVENKRRWRENPGWTGRNLTKLESPNGGEKRLARILRGLGFRFVGDGRFRIGRKCPDFVHRTKKIAVELFGSRFHRYDTGRARRAYFARRGYCMCVVRGSRLRYPRWIRRQILRALEA